MKMFVLMLIPSAKFTEFRSLGCPKVSNGLGDAMVLGPRFDQAKVS